MSEEVIEADFLIAGGYLHNYNEPQHRCPFCKSKCVMFWAPAEAKAFCVACDRVSPRVSLSLLRRSYTATRDLYFKKIME